jgi:uncharacterized protein
MAGALWRATFVALLTLVITMSTTQTFAESKGMSGPEIPALTGYVMDIANVIPPDVEAQLEARLAALEEKANSQLVVVTVPDLKGMAIEQYGFQLRHAWKVGMGGAGTGRSVVNAPSGDILILDTSRSTVFIETDPFPSGKQLIHEESVDIILRLIMPELKNNDIVGGIIAGVDGIEAVLAQYHPQWQTQAQRDILEEVYTTRELGRKFGIGLFIVVLIMFFIGLLVLWKSGSLEHLKMLKSGNTFWTATTSTKPDAQNEATGPRSSSRTDDQRDKKVP